MLRQVNLVQCDNLSWFGYPDDPIPSVRATLLPGITQARLADLATCLHCSCSGPHSSRPAWQLPIYPAYCDVFCCVLPCR